MTDFDPSMSDIEGKPDLAHTYDAAEANNVAVASSADVERRLARVEINQGAIAREVRINTALTRANNEVMRDVKAMLDACRLGLKVLGGVGVAFKWISSAGAGVGILYAAWQWVSAHK